MIGFDEALDNNRIFPVILLDIELLNSGGTVYFSDRTVLVGSTYYQDYILNASDIADSVRRESSTGDTPSVTIVFHNKEFRTLDHLSLLGITYPFSGGKVTIKEVYLDDNNVPSDEKTLFVGRFEEIKDETIEQFTLVAMNIKTANALESTGRV